MTYVIRQQGTREHARNVTPPGECGVEPRDLTYPRARAILHAHDRHLGCRQWIAAAAYLSAGLDDE
jgi:hypothetical protein